MESDVAGFLGILISRKEDGLIKLLQTGLIDKILKIMRLEESHERSTPSDIKPLHKDESGVTCSEPWSYASIIGLMLYLANNSRPDIACAVNSAAQFTHCPGRCHEKTLKRIARYFKLQGHNNDLSLDLYADSDFAGLWTSDKHQKLVWFYHHNWGDTYHLVIKITD